MKLSSSPGLVGWNFQNRVLLSRVTVGGVRWQYVGRIASLVILMMLCSCKPSVDVLPIHYVARDGRSTLNLQKDGTFDYCLADNGAIQFLGGTWVREGEVVKLRFLHGSVSMRARRSKNGIVELRVLSESEEVRVLRDWGLDIVFVASSAGI